MPPLSPEGLDHPPRRSRKPGQVFPCHTRRGAGAELGGAACGVVHPRIEDMPGIRLREPAPAAPGALDGGTDGSGAAVPAGGAKGIGRTASRLAGPTALGADPEGVDGLTPGGTALGAAPGADGRGPGVTPGPVPPPGGIGTPCTPGGPGCG